MSNHCSGDKFYLTNIWSQDPINSLCNSTTFIYFFNNLNKHYVIYESQFRNNCINIMWDRLGRHLKIRNHYQYCEYNTICVIFTLLCLQLHSNFKLPIFILSTRNSFFYISSIFIYYFIPSLLRQFFYFILWIKIERKNIYFCNNSQNVCMFRDSS